MNKQYIISLHKKHSVIALIACLISLACSLYSIYAGIVHYVREGLSPVDFFQYFTSLSGSYCGLTSGLIIPFAVDGIRKKRFTCPRWLSLLHYSSVICTTLVFVFTLCFISWYDPQLAFGRQNFFLHLVCPILILMAFQMTETYHLLERKHIFICALPVMLYMCIYLYKVVITKQWKDLYHFTAIPFYISLVLMLGLCYLLAAGIRKIYNRKTEYYQKQVIKGFDDGLDEVAVKIEVYGLGRYIGLNGTYNDVSLNLDIIRAIADKYGIRLEDLTRTYCKGVIDGLREQSS